ncbi:MAG: alpha/beta hydrolase [Proteobacteria bacterium]|nr:alpha/beta hydrolase [Pseudomonadota bacterium]
MRRSKVSTGRRKFHRCCTFVLRIFAVMILATSLQAADETTNKASAPSASMYRSIAGRDLRIFHFPPADSPGTARPAVLLVQGGAWTRGSPEQLYRSARYFSEAGFVATVLEYRLADVTNSPVESFSDVCHALAYMRTNADTLGLAPSRIALWGISSSGQLTAATATVGCDSADGSSGNGGPDALLLVSPVVDALSDGLFRDLMKGHGKPSAFSPTHTLKKRIVPTFIMQGNADRTTPIERSKVFCDRARNLGGKCELVALDGQGHVLDRVVRDEVLARQAAFLRDLWH